MNWDKEQILDAINRVASEVNFEEIDNIGIASAIVTFGFQSWGQNKKVFGIDSLIG